MDPAQAYEKPLPPNGGQPAADEYVSTVAPPAYVPPAADYAAAPAGAPAGAMPYATAPAPLGMQAPAAMYVGQPGVPPNQVMHTAPPPGKGAFTTGLCDCCEGPSGLTGCLISWLVPCWAHGIIGDVVADGVGRMPPFSLNLALYSIIFVSNLLHSCTRGWLILFEIPAYIASLVIGTYGRKRMREKYGIPGECFPGDFCTVCWCHCCALAQEMRHIRDHMPNRDFELLENRTATRTDLDFFNRSLAPYFLKF